jgi:hypothetical protein
MQNEHALSEAIRQSPDWQQAVDDFIDCTTQLGQSFTSGHIASILRVYRPEFRFKVQWIGERVQDKFYSGAVSYRGIAAVQVPRTCAGLGRTPAGQTVFVYAPDEDEAQNFPFELDIPEPGAQLTQMPAEHPIAATPPTPMLPATSEMTATVHTDHRLCIPRVCLEALLHKTGRSFRGGKNSVWVRFDDNVEHAIITLDQVDGAVDYDITSRGRILFVKAGSGRFEPGDTYAVEVQGDELVVDITKTL